MRSSVTYLDTHFDLETTLLNDPDNKSLSGEQFAGIDFLDIQPSRFGLIHLESQI